MNLAQVNRRRKKGRGGVIAIIVVLVVVGAVAAAMIFNFNNIRYMTFDALRSVPLIGGLIPDTEGAGPALTPQEAMLQRQLDAAQRELENFRTQNESLRADVERLRDFEVQQESFRDQQEVLVGQMISDDPAAFWRLFEQMRPDQAELLAQGAAQIVWDERHVREFLTVIGYMDERRAAGALDILMLTDSGRVVSIINGLPPDQSALIMDRMDEENRANLIRLMQPEGM